MKKLSVILLICFFTLCTFVPSAYAQGSSSDEATASKTESIVCEVSSALLFVGATYNLNAYLDSASEQSIEYISENPAVASVNSQGEIFAWHEGTANIILSSPGFEDLKVSVNVANCSRGIAMPLDISRSALVSSGNAGKHNLNVYGDTIKSYLVENDDSTFTIVYAHDQKVFIDTYDYQFDTRVRSGYVEYPLEIFGGFYSAKDYYFLVFGSNNELESDSKEVIRVEKYSKNWELLDSVSLYGENTYVPFAAGSLRMEESQGKLYVHTCHKMYKASDGNNHQANMTFVIDMETTEVTESFSKVLNLSQGGYVSHSFNQFIKADNDYIYRVDHGDAYPRGIALTKIPAGGSVTDVEHIIPITFTGRIGANTTGASLGAVELSSSGVLIVGNITSGEDQKSPVRNVFVNITEKDFSETKTICITDHKENGEVTALTPHLVKLGADQYMLLWEEVNLNTGDRITKITTLDSRANMTSSVIEVPFELSDCAPVFAKDKTVKWFVSDGDDTYIYSINPFLLDGVRFMNGDVNDDAKVNIRDATEIQKFVANMVDFDKLQSFASDVDGDLKVNIRDATRIQKYAAKMIDDLVAK